MQVEHETIRKARHGSDGITWMEYKSMAFTSQVVDRLGQKLVNNHLTCTC